MVQQHNPGASGGCAPYFGSHYVKTSNKVGEKVLLPNWLGAEERSGGETASLQYF